MSKRTALLTVLALTLTLAGIFSIVSRAFDTRVAEDDATLLEPTEQFTTSSGESIGLSIRNGPPPPPPQDSAWEDDDSSDDLDAWYAETGNNGLLEEPKPENVEPDLEDHVFLIEDAEPTSDAAPEDF